MLERGQLSASIVHRNGTRWRIDAGPFQVHVVGTAFDVSWDGAQFALALHEGAVRVESAALPAGRTVRAGERVVIAPGSDVHARSSPAPTVQALAPPDVRALPAPAAHPLPPSSVRGPPALDVQTPAPEPRAPAFTRRRAGGLDTPSWRKLATQGAYEPAFRALTDAGLEVAIASASAADLLIIADVARFTHHLAQADGALQALRTRFARHAEAGDAAFLLGRLAFDQRAAPAEAAGWFVAYLDERPQGNFAREARGRLIECYQRLDDMPRAQRAAQQYLAEHPGGPHEALARAVLAPQEGDSGE